MKYNIVFAIDSNYLEQIRVAIISILNSNQGKSFIFHILHSDLSFWQQKKLTRFISKRRGKCYLYCISSAMVKNFLTNEEYPSLVCLYRLLISDLLPKETEKVLYLDADTVICDDLASLFSINLNNKAVGAIKSLYSDRECVRLGIEKGSGYFNSGVLLIDFQKWSKLEIKQQTIDYFQRNLGREKVWQYPDQDVLNTLFQGEWHELDPKYNVYSCCWWFKPDELSEEQRRAVLDPSIIHFVGAEKPWLSHDYKPYREIYQKFQKQACVSSPFFFLNRFFTGRE